MSVLTRVDSPYWGEVTQLIRCTLWVTSGGKALTTSIEDTVVEGNQGGAKLAFEVNRRSKYVFSVLMLAENMLL